MDLPSSRSEAVALGSKRFFTGKPCVRGHVAHRQTSNNGCMDCNKQAVKKWREKTGYKTCPEYLKHWNQDNAEKVRSYQANRDRSKLAARNIRKRARMRLCEPSWLTEADKMRMSLIYEHAKDCTLSTGEKYEVDHIVPIMGETVCGLHVPWNLQVLHMTLNRKKRNKH